MRALTTLYVVEDAPYPPRSGSPLRAWQNINLLARLGPVHVYSIGKRDADASMPRAASWTHVDAREFPVRTSSSLARLRRGIWPREFPIENDFVGDAMNRRLREIVERVKPDVIVVAHWHNALPRALRGRHLLIADAHNVEFEVVARELSAGFETLSLRSRYRIAQARRRERSYLHGVDRIWATSDRDAAVFQTAFAPLPPIDVVPNAIDLDAYAGFEARKHLEDGGPTIGYIGFYGYGPNAEAAAALVDTIFPAIRSRLPDTSLMLVGRAPTERMKQAACSDPQITVTGEVDDVRAALRRIDLLVVPLLGGSGTRLKILEAFAACVPVVTSAKGIEGIEATPGIHAEVCSLPEMADRCAELLADPGRRCRLVAAAHALVADRYSWEALARSRAFTVLQRNLSIKAEN